MVYPSIGVFGFFRGRCNLATKYYFFDEYTNTQMHKYTNAHYFFNPSSVLNNDPSFEISAPFSIISKISMSRPRL